jgi:hypothetical protein
MNADGLGSGRGSGFPGTDEEGIEYIDALDADLSAFLAQIGTLVLVLGVALNEGLQDLATMEADLALQAAIKADAMGALHTGVGYMKTVSEQLTLAQSAVSNAKEAGDAAQSAVASARTLQRGESPAA